VSLHTQKPPRSPSTARAPLRWVCMEYMEARTSMPWLLPMRKAPPCVGTTIPDSRGRVVGAGAHRLKLLGATRSEMQHGNGH
jgi:hypothetical protein